MVQRIPDDFSSQIEELEGSLRLTQVEGRANDGIEIARRIADLREQHQGAEHWEAVDARVRADFTGTLGGMSLIQRSTLTAAQTQFRKGADFLKQRRLGEAEECLRESVQWYRQTLGDSHPHLAAAIVELGSVRFARGKLAEAEQLAREAVSIRRTSLGDAHPQTAVGLNNLALYLTDQNRLAEAETMHRDALRIKLDAYGERHRSTVQSVNNLACNLHSQGRYADAEPLFQQAVRLRTELLGERHPDTATVLNNLARNRKACGRHAEAEQIYRQALEYRREELGDEHPDTLNSSSTLAASLHAQGKSAEAEELLRPVFEIRRETLGLTHCDSIEATNNLASVLKAQEKYPEAETLFRESVDICQESLGKLHANTALAMHNLGGVLNAQGRFEDAEDRFREGLAICRQVLGDVHSSTALVAASLAACLQAQNRLPESEAEWRAAVQYYESARQRVSFSGLGRSAFAARRSPYPGLTTVLARQGKATEAWESLEAGFGRGLLDDLTIRNARQLDEDDHTREQELSSSLHRAQSRFDALGRNNRIATDDDRMVQARRDADLALEELNRFDTERNEKHGGAIGQIGGLAAVQSVLPSDAALVAWVDIEGRRHSARSGGEHWACIARCEGVPQWIELTGINDAAGWSDDDDELPKQLSMLLRQPGSPWLPSAERLFQQRVQPLLDHLTQSDALPNVTRLIVLPSPALAGLPVEVLVAAGGDFAATFTVSYAPSASLLVWLAQQRAKRSTSTELSMSSRILALGDPEFANAARLPGTRDEVESIAALFDDSTVLAAADASGASLEQLVSTGQLAEYEIVHLATHATIDPVVPLRSALVLAASGPVDDEHDSGVIPDDRLTAEQILRTWSLDCHLVTLSACQSGLGEDNRGEGFLGFSQALFLAGTRSLILSLWKVDDTATALLMQRFYQNLVGSRSKRTTRMATAAALEEARQWLRSTLDSVPGEADNSPVDRDLSSSPDLGPDTRHSYDHPFYWAGFILVGIVGD